MNKSRKLTLLILLFLVPLGFYTKFYQGYGETFVHNYLGGFLYVVFWILVVFFISPHTNPVKISAGVFVATSLIEFSQLWHPPFLETLRANFLGRTILGTSFVWYDFIWYLAGAVAGYFLVIRFLASKKDVNIQ